MHDVWRPLIALSIAVPAVVLVGTIASEDMSDFASGPPAAATETTTVPVETTIARATGDDVASRSEPPETTTSTTIATISAPPTSRIASRAATNAAKPAPKSSSVATPVPVAKGAGAARMAAQLLEAINRERAARGLAPLLRDGNLDGMGSQWSAHLASIGTMQHRSAQLGTGPLAGFNAFGENLFQGTGGQSARDIHVAWMQSPQHRKNIVQPGFDRVGIGVLCTSKGLWVTQEFGHTSAAGNPVLSPSTGSTSIAPWKGDAATC